MGLLDEYQTDLNDVPDAPSWDIDDDFYEFVVGDLYVRNGTTNKPDESWIIIDYSLGEEGKSKQEWFGLPADSSAPTDKEIQKLSFLKRRLIDLGASEEQLADLDPDDFIGKSGTLEVFTNKGFQNIKNVVLGDAAEAEAPITEDSDADVPAEKPAPAKKVTPTVAARKEAAAPAKAAASGVKKNPFANK